MPATCRVRNATIGCCLAVTIGGCRGSAPRPEEAGDELLRDPLDASEFVDPTLATNPWSPTHPGLPWVREGTTEVGSREVHHQVVTTMADVIRTIDAAFKYDAPGIGLILDAPRRDSIHRDTERLINFTELTPEGLAEVSETVLAHERHARETEPAIFGHATLSRRLG